MHSIEQKIQNMWDKTEPVDMQFVSDVIGRLDRGEIRVANRENGQWHVNAYVKRAILLYMQNSQSVVMNGGYDKIPLKTENWTAADFDRVSFRIVPGAIIRRGAYIAPGVVIMPSFVNIGAYIGSETMIDTHATVGSCATIGSRCHISDGVTIGGVLEPLQAIPVIVEDNCFIGAGSRITEGVIVETGSVVASGTIVTQSTPIIDRFTGAVSYGRIPSYSVVVPGSRPIENGLQLSCAVIVKKVDQDTLKKSKINDLLRDSANFTMIKKN